MYSKAFTFLLCLIYISFVNSGSAPFITKCKWDDSKCHKENAVKTIPLFADGIPELNVEKLDPMTLKRVDASTSSIKLILTDATVTGLKNCEVKKIQRNEEKTKLLVKILCTCNLDGQYEMKGQLLVLPIEGKGPVHVVIRKLLIAVDVDLKDTVDKDGKKHWAAKSWKHSFALKDKSDVKFENLFPNNELLRKTTTDLIADNGNDVITEVGAPIIKAVVTKVVENTINFFAAVPIEELIAD